MREVPKVRNASFDFFPFCVALSSFKYPQNGVLMEKERERERERERGGRCKMSAPAASGLLEGVYMRKLTLAFHSFIPAFHSFIPG